MNSYKIALLVFWSVSAFADITIKADSTHYNHSKSFLKLTDHVLIQSDREQIYSDLVHAYLNSNNKIKEAIIYGGSKQVKYIFRDTKQEPIEIYADKLEFYPLSDTVIGLGNVKIYQNGNSHLANKVIYNTKTRNIQSLANTNSKVVMHLNVG